MPRVNLWELMTTVANLEDSPNRENCRAIKAMTGPRFGTELSLEVGETGAWIVKVFNHDDSSDHVTMSISPSGFVQITRGRTTYDVHKERSISF